jgi:hypothetical protein
MLLIKFFTTARLAGPGCAVSFFEKVVGPLPTARPHRAPDATGLAGARIDELRHPSLRATLLAIPMDVLGPRIVPHNVAHIGAGVPQRYKCGIGRLDEADPPLVPDPSHIVKNRIGERPGVPAMVLLTGDIDDGHRLSLPPQNGAQSLSFEVHRQTCPLWISW